MLPLTFKLPLIRYLKPILSYIIFCSLISVTFISIKASAAIDADKKSTDQKLSTVQKAISQQKSTIRYYSKARKKLAAKLENDDIAIGKVVKKLRDTQKKLTTTQQKIIQLAKEKSQLQRQKKHQEKLLAQQLRAAYSNGHHDYLKLILNQEQAAKVQRSITYYQYLNKARIKEIDAFKQILSALLQASTHHQEQVAQLKTLTQQQQKQRQALELTKQKRAKTLIELSKDLLNSQQQLATLKAEEENLVSALKKLATLAKKQISLTGLNKLKNKLHWPLKGKILHSYGSQKQGYLKWKGVLMSAPIGRQVQSIHNGTVLFANWLKGYGLVTVIDHGNGYMSLYAHAQTLLKNVGDQVETGEPIALVGQSGGKSQPSLYFEIRHRGKAVNPKLWCRR